MSDGGDPGGSSVGEKEASFGESLGRPRKRERKQPVQVRVG